MTIAARWTSRISFRRRCPMSLSRAESLRWTSTSRTTPPRLMSRSSSSASCASLPPPALSLSKTPTTVATERARRRRRCSVTQICWERIRVRSGGEDGQSHDPVPRQRVRDVQLRCRRHGAYQNGSAERMRAQARAHRRGGSGGSGSSRSARLFARVNGVMRITVNPLTKTVSAKLIR